MKIFQVSTFFHPVTGGVEAHVAMLNRYLKNMGHEVTVLTSDASKVGPRVPNKRGSFEGTPIVRFRHWFALSEYHKFYPGLFFYLMRNDFDIVHVHGFRKLETYICWLAAKLKRKKVILTTHNPFPTTTRSKLLEVFVWLHDLTLGRLLIKHLDAIITILESENEIFIKKFKVPPQKVTTVYNGLNPELLEPGDGAEFAIDNNIDLSKWKGVVVGCGRLNYAKGFQFLEQAVKKLPNVLFYIAGGDDGYQEELMKLYQNRENIIFSGKFLPQDKLRDVYSMGDIFVLPSIHEATGTVMLEALAQGCAIIASRNGGTREYLSEEHGIFIDPKDQEEWVEKIRLLLDKPELREELTKNNRVFLKKYRWDTLAKKINKIYERI